MRYSVRIKLKSVKHYTRCVATLREYGIVFNTFEQDELILHRFDRKDWKNKGWLYIGLNDVGYMFQSIQPVQYAVQMTLKELTSHFKGECVCQSTK